MTNPGLVVIVLPVVFTKTMPKLSPVVSRDSMEDWFESNPLRQWRKRWKLTRKVLAHILKVSNGTVQNWEYGLGQPQAEHFARLNGGTSADWPGRWEAWLKKKPETEPQQKTA